MPNPFPASFRPAEDEATARPAMPALPASFRPAESEEPTPAPALPSSFREESQSGPSEPAPLTYGPSLAQLQRPVSTLAPPISQPPPLPHLQTESALQQEFASPQRVSTAIESQFQPVTKTFGLPSATDIYDRGVQAVKDRYAQLPAHAKSDLGMRGMAEIGSGLAAVGRIVPEGVDFMTSPGGVATAAVLGPVAKVAPRLAGAGMSAAMAPQAVKSVGEAIEQPSGQTLGTAAKDVAMAAVPLGMVRRPTAATPKPGIVPEPAPVSAPPIAVEALANPERGSIPISPNRKTKQGRPTPPPIHRERKPLAQTTFSSVEADDFTKDVSNFYNVDRYKVSPEAKIAMKQAVEDSAPEIARLNAGRMTLDEIQQMAAQRPDLVKTTRTDSDSTLTEIVRGLNARMVVAQSAERMQQTGKVTAEDLKAIQVVKTMATDVARKLNAFKAEADPARRAKATQQASDLEQTAGRGGTQVNDMLNDILKVEKDMDRILAEAGKYDLRDPEQATSFYRTFIKPTTGDWMNALRYSSMLSSPVTQATNIAGNLTGLPVRALTKAVEGGMDAALSAGSRLMGKERPRTRYADESLAYIKGASHSVNRAAANFTRVLQGAAIDSPDYKRQIPLTTKDQTVLRPLEQTLTAPQKFMEAADQFFKALAEGGETQALTLRQSRGTRVPQLNLQAEQLASHSLFRSKLGESATGGSQGHVLNLMDSLPRHINQARKSEEPLTRFMANVVFPFVTTPANIFKQGVEYSPLGFTTLAGHSDKLGQSAKAAIGTAAATGLAMLVGSDRLTWGEPTNPKAKAEFRAAGRLPYSVRIGDQWVQFSRLHPSIAFPMAAVANIKQLYDARKIGDDFVQDAMQIMARNVNFLADQSMLKSLGDLIGATRGDEEALVRTALNPVTQFIPHRAFVQWVERLTDPVQRKADPTGTVADQQWEQLKLIVPGLAQSVPARTDSAGNPVPNPDFHSLRSISPVRTSAVNPGLESEYQDSQRLAADKSKLDKAADRERSQSDKLWQKIRSLPPAERHKATLDTLESMALPGQDRSKPTPGQRHLIDLYTRQDWSDFERHLYATPIALRAKTIKEKIDAMPEGERVPKLEELERKKIITRGVREELGKLGVR